MSKTHKGQHQFVSETLAHPVTQKAIRRVVLLGFTLVIFLLLAAGLLGVRSLSSIRSTMAELQLEQVRTQELLDAVLREQGAINSIYVGFAGTPGAYDRDKMLGQLTASDRAIAAIAASALGSPVHDTWLELYKAVTRFSIEARAVLADPEKDRPIQPLMMAHQEVLMLVGKLVETQARRAAVHKQRLEELSWRMLRDSAGLLGMSLLLALLSAIYTVRLTVSLIRQLEWQTAELSRVSWNLLEKQETTARRFSHELHDELGQSLTAVKANLSTMTGAANGARAQLEDCLHLVEEAIVNVRELSQLLRPTILDDFGLPAGVKWLCDRFQQRTGIAVECVVSLDGRVADETETHLFRIAQEALTNVARHSKATRVEVSLGKSGAEIRLRIADNGQGVQEEAEPVARGLGLVGMRARARSAGGEVRVQSAPGEGMEIIATFPMSERVE
ncbi:MAG TPA: sensor histidine kinase [Paludibaculum sp.]